MGIFALLTCAYVTPNAAHATAGINQQINFQGRLLNSQGATVPDGYYNIQFKIYQDGDGQSVGDTTGSPAGTLKWTESHLNANSQGIMVKNGFMSVQLGSVTAFGSSVDWNQDTLWLSMNIGDTNVSCTPFSSCTPDGEMVPMKRMSATPYALNSGLLNGLTSGNFVQLAQGVQTDASTNTTSIFLNKTAGGNFLELQASGTNTFTLSNSGDIAFGANANHTLSVTTAAASTAGKQLTVSAGGGGSGTGSAGGDLVLQGGAAGGTDGNGGNITINAGAKTGTGTDGTISIGTANTSAITLGQNTSVTGTLGVSSNVDTNGSLTVGTADQFIISNAGVVTAGTWQGSAILDTYIADTLTVDSSSSVDWLALTNYPGACAAGSAVTQLGDTITCSAFATGTAANYIQNQSASAQTLADFWISGNGRVSGSLTADTSVLTATLDTATATALNIGTVGTPTTTAINLNQNTTLAAGKSLTVTGSGTRPTCPCTAGTLYFDTSTNQLIQWNGSKWISDRSTATKIIAPSNASPAAKDAADVTLTGTGDETLINTALSTSAGGKVYIMEGTVSLSGAISIPNDTTLAGAGRGTIITIPNSFNANIDAITNTDTSTGTGVVVQDIRLEGNSSNQTSGFMYGVHLIGMGSGTGAGATQGAKITNVVANNWATSGFYLFADSNNILTGNTAQGNGSAGFDLSSSPNNTVTNNLAQGNFTGFYINDKSNTITGNTAQGNSVGFYIGGGSGNTITGNTADGNTTGGIDLASGSNHTVSGNTIVDSGGTTNNGGITVEINSSSNHISGNNIVDSSATVTNYAIDIQTGSTGNYLANNTLGAGSINNAGTGTIYGGQLNSSGNFVIQPAGTVELMKDTNVTGSLSASVSLLTPLLDAKASGALEIGTNIATSIQLKKNTTITGDLTFESSANRTISIATAAASTAGKQLTLAAGAGGSGTGSVGGTMVIQGGAAGGTNGNGGNVTIDGGAKAGTGTDGNISIGTVRATTIQVGSTTLSSGTQTIGIGNNNTTGGTTNVTVGAGGSATGGTTTIQSKDTTTFATNGTTRATFASGSNTLYVGNGNATGLAASPNSFTIQATSNSGTGAGGALTIQAGGSGASANGADLTLNSGTGGNSVNGQVVISTPTFKAYSGALQKCTGAATTLSLSQPSIDNFGTVSTASDSSANCVISVPNPTITTAGRVLYVTADNTSTSSFVLSINGGGAGNLVAMRANSSATLVWNGSKWAPAGASSSTTLQAAYDNTIQSSGGAELIISKTASTNGLTIRDDLTNSVNGALVNIQSKTAANLFSVNSNVTDYASDPGAETQGASGSTFPSSTWSAYGIGASIARNTTTNNNTIATGQASAAITTGATGGTGAQNQIVDPTTGSATTLAYNNHYNVSFSVRLPSGASTFSDLAVNYQYDNNTAHIVSCPLANSVVAQSVWTKVNCSFTAPSTAVTITSANVIRIEQTGGTARTFYVDNLSVTIAADYSVVTDGGSDVAANIGNSGSTWDKATFGGTPTGTVAQNTNDGQAASTSVKYTSVPATAKVGIRNKLAINPLPSTLYRVTVYAKSSTAFSDFTIRYTPTTAKANTSTDANYTNCQDYNTQTVSTSAWTKITCYILTDSTVPDTSYLYFVQQTGSARDISVDTASMTLATATTPNVQVGSGTNGGPTTLFTLDRGASAPIAGDNDALLGSMYYDTTLGKLQCYEADGWGACGSSPDNIITISPEYTNAVMHGTGVGTMTSDLCSDFLDINDATHGTSICGTNETYNFYNWTSPQASSQTYSIYVTYQLPSTFKSFTSGSTSLQGRVSSTSNASVSYGIYKSTGSSMVQCGSNVSVASVTPNAWETKVASGAADPSTCGFAAGNSVIFKISLSSNSNANAYIGNIGFTFSNN